MKTYQVIYVLEPISLYKDFGLDGNTFIEATDPDDARNRFVSSLLAKNINAEILDIRELENFDDLLGRLENQ